MDNTVALAKEYVDIKKQLDELGVAEGALKERKGVIEEQLITVMLQDGVQNINVDDVLVYLSSIATAKPIDKGVAIQRLIDHGMYDCLSVNSRRIAALLGAKEADEENGGEVPEEVRQVFEFGAVPRLNARKSKKGG